MSREGNKVILTFKDVGGGLDTFDVRTPVGFTIAGENKEFAWSDNPVCNVQNREGLPVTPFRTDEWPGVTSDNH